MRLTPREVSRGAQRSIDSFFESLARDRAGSSIGVVLSGTASDGTLGLEAIKAEGGITFAQDDSAKFDSMPRNAIAAGCVDFVLPPDGIAAELARIAKHPLVSTAAGKIQRGERIADQLQRSAPTPAAGVAKSKLPRSETQDDEVRTPSPQESSCCTPSSATRTHSSGSQSKLSGTTRETKAFRSSESSPPSIADWWLIPRVFSR